MALTPGATLPALPPQHSTGNPLRSELLGADLLADLARSMASATAARVQPGSHALLHRLRDNGAVLRKARDASAAAAQAEPLMPDAEWLLDNFFVIEEVLREVKTDLPRGYSDELPVVQSGPWAGLPRVYEIAVALVSHTDSHLDESLVLRFVKAYQEVRPLTSGELWAVPTMLRLALLENLRRLAAQMLDTRTERERAVAWVQRAATGSVPPLPGDPTDAFLVSWHQAVRDLGESPPVVWDVAGDLTEVLRREHRRQAANQVSVGHSVMSLRLLHAIDWTEFFERVSLVEAALRTDPTGVYPRQELATRNRYRQAVEEIAKAAKRDEADVARLALERAARGATPREKHVGYHLVAEGRKPFARELGCRFPFRLRWRRFLTDRPHTAYFGSLALVTALIVAGVVAAAAGAGAPAWLLALAALAVLLPATDVAVAVVNATVCRVLPPRVLPKLDFTAGVPAEFATVVVIPGMLTRPESAAALCERLELHYLANPDPRLKFALLTDWADAPTGTTPKDDALVAAAVAGIRRLNERHAPDGQGLFFLFHRKRQFNAAEGAWMGWERKRGKLEEFNRLLRGATDTSYVVQTGDAAALDAKFVLTLDADTVLPRDAARRMIATLAHPLNRPVLSPDGRRVVAGFGVLQPRVSFLYKTGLRSRFARIFAGSAGIDPYSSASSDVYQDLFGWGTFTGKGLYDVDAFHATAGTAFPENSILSHDLIESNFARCGLVTDVEVFDDFPAKYHAYAKREHRWVRGDWQLLPWLGRNVPTPAGKRRNPLTLLGRWKVTDNLRRSLVPAALVVLLALGWTVLPGPAFAWSLVALAVLAVPLALQLVNQALDLVFGNSPGVVIRGAAQSLPATVGQVALAAVFLPNQAALAVDAILRTLYRVFVSRRRMLEWETAAAAEARLGTGLAQFVRSMWWAVAVAGGLAALVAWANPDALPAAAPWLVAWLLSPVVAWFVSLPLKDAEPPLTDVQRAELRRTARKTWRFFETFVTAEDNWLPPDNYQENPKGVVAHRTSPTNKGLLLLSTLSAHDLGYVSLPDLAARLGRTLDTFDRMQRFKGHFLNWYETTTLRPLPPDYVSTVDSGNLLGCLLAVKNGLVEKAAAPVPSPGAAAGLGDTLKLAAESLAPGATDAVQRHLAAVPTDLLAWSDWLEAAEKLARQLPVPAGEGAFWVRAFGEQVRGLRDELAAVCPWLPALRAVAPEVRDADALSELNTPASVKRWAERLPALRAALAKEAAAEPLVAALDRSKAADLKAELHALAGRAEAFADAMDFRFLYNESRHLFSIGYNVPLERLDSAHYDLLASEAALTSFLAVARGVVPRKHWFQLGRLVTPAGGLPGLISWGGTMFEYLMPRLVLAPAAGTMLDVAHKATVKRQEQYGRETRVPWGVSESGFAVLSAEGDYQYQSFGVPGLGLKRGLGKDLVVAPYATLLATMIDAPAAVANFAALRGVGGEGAYGFFEAIDFTPDRLDRGEKCRVVQSYMAHHQGMGLCAITNRLLRDVHCQRLHAEPAVRAVELLLQERVPLDAPEVRPTEVEAESATPLGAAAEVSRRLTTADTPAPRAHLLSNGNYTVMLTNAGGGFSTCRGQAVTRWRTDPTRDPHGAFVYLRDPATGKQWSVGHQPLAARADEYEVVFSADKAEFRRRDGLVESRLEVVVAPDQDAEVRRLTLANHDTRPHTIEVTSYAEVVLNDPRADLAHPAFGKLFLETEWVAQYDALVCRRRPRAATQQPVFAVHLVAADDAAGRVTEYETDRAKFLGRRRSAADPEGLARRLSCTVGPVLDPVFALRKTVRVEPGATATLAFVTAVSPSRDAALALASHYHSLAAAERAFDLAWAHSRVELRHLGVAAAESHVYQRLVGHVLFPPPALRALNAVRDNRQGQPGLWKFGISGDVPIVVVCVADGDGMPLARQALKAHAFWRGRGFPVDLVLLADRPATYREELYQDLAALARASDSRDVIDKPGGVFVRKVQPGDEDRTLLLAAARVVLYGDQGTLADQTDAVARNRRLPADLVPTRPGEPEVPDRPEVDGLRFFNGTGGFSADGREYVVTGTPPAPWANVVANPSVGFLATDAGLGYTWAGNSQANRLTPWANDPVTDPPAEVVYVRDEETGHFWTPTPRPAGGPTVTRHGAGYTTYAAERDGLETTLTAFVPAADPVKVLRLSVANLSDRPRRLSAAYFAEWVLGTTREQTAPYVATEIDADTGALLARCAFSDGFGSAVAFADTSLRPRTVSGNRTEFLGRNRSPASPAALKRVGLGDHVGPGLDPCAALMGRFEVAAGGTAEVVFVIGQAATAQDATRLAKQYRDPQTAAAALQDVTAAWDRRLSTVTVRTPAPELDVLVNRWLPYQVLACRLWGRSALYQSGGAFGFRDQLQDVMALVYAEPAEARAHILRAAGRQFPEGDVQHWWHPPSGRGVRTRFSDDFLWLAYAASHYVRVTGDAAVLDEEAPFLRGRALKPEEQEEYFQPETGDESATLYRHCLRALSHGWKLGPHGLPLMGCGDWNDGMNLVGAGGVGESVWVAWFQVLVRNEFAVVAEARGDAEIAKQLRAEADELRAAVEAHAWDGGWYLRAWFDDGTPLGSHANDECRIDSLPQTWAVLSGGGDPARSRRAVGAAVEHLVDRESRLVKLFQPPFDKGGLNPGYIKGYVPGIRENGGQYTHAAIWLVQALAGLGRGGDALALWTTLAPTSHTGSPEAVATYKVEPYVVAADVYGVPPHVGRGGWTWYTGSAAWLYRAAVETLLGFTKRGDALSFDPRIPAEWDGFEVDYRFGGTLYRCRVENPGRVESGVADVWLDGTQLPDKQILLRDDGAEHAVRILLGR
ncbi:glycosyltransferase 36 : Cellobiose phosphorylase OS=Singulisphaera acidiphila (strain ATCC BAA-1392 / DSM 18658 / VKM B-2454 / MOB10) GN=Sinac_1249 PE=4 SV=1: Glycoamylase: CBM_X: Glyco_transf_36: GT36_AF: CBM_X: Glyco_transf_36: GT36_AF [Gemmataceae bacterium]|nr:glycosyltransferase 36 : Cellobiose phosphorylase OS=Singulisphaera acidiphila (strain ATCC BAA-1392 / DSM 18658 / VKM B-2454 / MOB10) GN=Sinac_1249 PE=4 SV=1: Glycoamylase: CBM_X: Glyco_transf_36: GT36_AF: CBM_X: Glyco_transf_36: GT36_AF [Gemmataceae bacterium]VTT97780.1 glycosyltransferase 36 : Cellobiose phosphorylase OS=Singulisphaera acidiphila (strain ATCC BAA-1392 / DSM 18658 / VKM B-2454 / MOB10) GN=Sinac_1249 PE=4 SV=1: Glycoamylase: CBM_X: Glyco_transf_36: GT36_AF: CBM_X: Glyco_transf